MKNSFYIIILLLGMSCTPSTSNRVGAGPIPIEPGKCFSKCLSTNSVIIDPGVLLPIYTGSDPGAVNLVTRSILINAGREKWVKKKSNGDCRSSDPDDCLVWCLEKVPAEYQEVSYLTDTIHTKEFKLQEFGAVYDEESGTIWMETLCDIKLDGVLEKLQVALIKNGANFLPRSGIFDAATKQALVKYQKNQKLCVGQLTVESLEALKVSYD